MQSTGFLACQHVNFGCFYLSFALLEIQKLG
jgi:hypothetical protein